MGSSNYVSDFLSEKVERWTEEIDMVSKIANSQPHAAYAALTHGLMSRWSFICRTVPHIQKFLEKLEDKLSSELIPKLTGRPPPGPVERSIFALPARLGGLGICDLIQRPTQDFEDCKDL